jgi:hypothetical protein
MLEGKALEFELQNQLFNRLSRGRSGAKIGQALTGSSEAKIGQALTGR